PLPDQCAVARLRGRAPPSRHPLPPGRRSPFLRAQGGEGRPRLPPPGRQPPRSGRLRTDRQRPPAQIGGRSVAQLERIPRQPQVSAFEAVLRVGEEAELGPAALQALSGFAKLIAGLGELSLRLPVPRLLERVVEETGDQSMLRDGTPPGGERWANVTELVGY